MAHTVKPDQGVLQKGKGGRFGFCFGRGARRTAIGSFVVWVVRSRLGGTTFGQPLLDLVIAVQAAYVTVVNVDACVAAVVVVCVVEVLHVDATVDAAALFQRVVGVC